MPFELLGPEPLDAVVNVRLTHGEKEKLREDARLGGLSVSALVRRRYFNRPVIASADRATIRELRRLGGLLKTVHIESKGAYSQQTAAMLADIQAAIRQLIEK